MAITEETIAKIARSVAKEVAKEVVPELLAGLGIDTENLRDTQADMLYLRNLRKSREDLSNKVSGRVILIVITGGMVFLWEAIKNKFGVK